MSIPVHSCNLDSYAKVKKTQEIEFYPYKRIRTCYQYMPRLLGMSIEAFGCCLASHLNGPIEVETYGATLTQLVAVLEFGPHSMQKHWLQISVEHMAAPV